MTQQFDISTVGAGAPITSTVDRRAGDTNTTTIAVEGEALILAKRRGLQHYEKAVNQSRAAGASDAEIAQAMADAPGVISPSKLPPLARGQRRAATELAEHATEIRRLGRQVVEDVVEIGGRLHACRALLKDDRGWRAWLKHELRLSPQSAGRFIQVHKLAQERSNLERAGLQVSALYAIAAPSTPEAAKTEVIARAEAGEVLPVAEVKRVIKAHTTASAIAKAETDAERSAEARKAAYAADEAATETTEPAPAENVPTKPSAKAKAALKREKKRRIKIAGHVADAFDALDQVLSAIANEPDLVNPDDLAQLLAKARELDELVQRARRQAARRNAAAGLKP